MTDNQDTSVSAPYELFSGEDSELARLIAEKDWGETPIGPRDEWPQSLKTAVSICLNSRFPMVVMWGEEFIFIYNDGYKIIAGENHPGALGKACKEIWPEIWDTVGPMLQLVLDEGKATWAEDMPLTVHRNNYPEETFFTFSYSPIPDESDGAGGVFATAYETTQDVLTQRRLSIVRELPNEAHSVEALGKAAADTFEENTRDVPFSLFYILNDDEQSIRLVGSSGLGPGASLAPSAVDLENNDILWPFGEVIASGSAVSVERLPTKTRELDVGPWPEPPPTAVVLPVSDPAEELPAGLLVLGVSPRRAFDEAYRSFFDSIADELATSLTNVRAYEEEHRRAEALAEIDRAKTTFFSNISHELRTPLTLMLGPLERLQRLPEEQLSSPVQAELDTMYRNGLRLLKLVNNMLEFSRIEAGRIEAQFRPTDLSTLTEDLASTFRSAIEQAGIEFRVDCPPLSEPVYADRDMWEKIVLNLLSNALKYTKEGTIEISLEEADEYVTLAVRDTGEGIPEEELPHLFERFHRVSSTEGRSHEGTGIGLALVDELTQLHGGTVGVESTTGEGSTFYVVVPLGRDHLPANKVIDTPSESTSSKEALPYIEETTRWLPHEEDKSSATSTPAAETGESTVRRGRILFVDDNPDMRAYVHRILHNVYAVDTAEHGSAALEQIRRREPDLVLADVMMPQMDGIALTKALRSDPSASSIPIILISAKADEEARVEGLEAGADDYLVKPFNERELKARIEGQLESAREALRRERKLRMEAQEAQEHILAGIRDGFVRLDEEWRYVYVNDRAANLAGRSKEELLGKSIWKLYPEAVDTELYQKLHEAIDDQKEVNFEYYHPSLDEWIEYWVHPSDDGLTIFEADITQRKQLEQQLLEVSEREKQEIGEALHDGLGQILTGTAMLCKSLLSQLDRESPELLETAAEIQSLLQEARSFNRNLMQGMLPVQLEQEGLVAALDRLVRQSERIFDVAITAEFDESVDVSDETIIASLYRIAQEGITNAARHGEAGEVNLTLERRGETIHLQIRDNGTGIPEQWDTQESGRGIHLMQHRARMIGGSLTIDNDEDEGTTVDLTMPLA